jgi:hypothetical protein
MWHLMVMIKKDGYCCRILSLHCLADLRLAKFLKVEETEFCCDLTSSLYCNITSAETLEADYSFTVDRSNTIWCNFKV